MANEVAVKGKQELATEMAAAWASPTMSAQDIVIPKILAMQGLSVAVTEGKAQMGEFRDSISNNLIGSIDKPFTAIPFYVDKVWDILEEQADGSFKWKRTVPVVDNPKSPDYNDNWKWEAEVNGAKVKNVRRYNFYFLLPSEVADGTAIPYIFSFKSTSIKEGKKLFTQMYMRNTRAGLPPAAFKIQVSGTREKNQKGVFIVPKYSLGEKATDAELSECLTWIGTIKQGKVKVDESDVQGSTDGPIYAEDVVGEF